MRRYETIVILRPSLGEADTQAVIDRATGIIESFEGSIIKIDKWGLKKLAYLIKKESQGFYVHILYAGLPAGVDEMERVFRIDDNVMKFLTVKLQDVYTPLPEDVAAETESSTPTETATAEPTETATEADSPAATETAEPAEEAAPVEEAPAESEKGEE